ncbi:MAG: protein translocase subunit SecD [Chitinophagales bacterium]|nr:protein translocase subunit SecD [Hyphomicrobiales bacterium]
MMYFAPWKIVTIFLVTFLSFLMTAPNFLDKSAIQGFPGWAPQRTIPLGLDLQGGSHLLMQMDVNELRQEWLKTIEGDARREMRGETQGSVKPERVAYTSLGIAGDAVKVTLRDPADLDKALVKLKKLAQPISSSLFTGSSNLDLNIAVEGPNAIVLRPTDVAFQERLTAALAASIEVIRKRIDFLGTTEPVIQRQGRERILVQVPGFNDPQKLKEIIGKPARLTFQLVDQRMTAEEAARTRPPEGTKLFPTEENPDVKELLREEVIVGGENLVDASASFDSRDGQPVVAFRFDTKGARSFAQVTQANVGRPFAIVLDGKVISAPNINEPILGGSGQISGRFTVDQVKALSTQLKSGALPASLIVAEERSVGPSLGADSIAAGKLAGIIGFIGVTAFLIIAYGLFGLFSIMALTVNLAIITAFMSFIGSTLTLPGIAGIVLTMGMSVDANVLINERIREELRSGKSPINAIDTAFTKAVGTITDTNLTGLLVAFIMFWLGSGPVRGFAVTLGIGIIASFFTATMITRYLVVQWVRTNRPTTVPI